MDQDVVRVVSGPAGPPIHGMEDVVGSIPTRATIFYDNEIIYLENTTNCWTNFGQEWQRGFSAPTIQTRVLTSLFHIDHLPELRKSMRARLRAATP